MGRRGRARLRARAAGEQPLEVATVRRPPATSSIVPMRTRFMWRMNVSASMRNSSRSSWRSQIAPTTLRRKRWWYESVGVKAVKSCVPASASAQACSAGKSTRCGHQRARVRSNGDGAPRASTR